jgi:hypothetical protein
LLLALAGSLAGAGSAASTGKSQNFTLGPGGELALNLPAGWTATRKTGPANLPPTLELKSGEEFVMLITRLPRSGALDRNTMRTTLERAIQPMVSQSVEKKAQTQPLHGPEIEGWFVSLTDSAPGPGEYKFMTQGFAMVGSIMIQFTVLSNDATQKIRDAGLEVLRSAGHRQENTAAKMDIAIPGQAWKVRVSNPGFGELQKRDEPGHFACRGQTADGFNLSVFVEKASGTGAQPSDVFDFYWPQAKRNPLIEPSSIKVFKSQGFVKVSYLVAGIPNANYYLAHRGRWIDVHVSQPISARTGPDPFGVFEQDLACVD